MRAKFGRKHENFSDFYEKEKVHYALDGLLQLSVLVQLHRQEREGKETRQDEVFSKEFRRGKDFVPREPQPQISTNYLRLK